MGSRVMNSNDATIAAEGVRERKRRETLRRISQAGMRLFITQGYEATTLDAIAAAAGISRRTFFYYFKSKDEILLSMQSGMGELLVTALKNTAVTKRPLDAIRDAIITVCAPFPADEMIAIDRVMRASEAVQARKQASYIQHEQALFAALRERWPAPERETALRLIAMLAVGAMRLSFDRFNREDGQRPIAVVLGETFSALEAEMRM